MAKWGGLGSGNRIDPNGWAHPRENDEADVVRRGVQFYSLTAAQVIQYSNGDRLYLVSATLGSTQTITFACATSNTGAEYVVRNITAGNVIVETAGGTLDGSATQSAANAASMWRSDGAVWRKIVVGGNDVRRYIIAGFYDGVPTTEAEVINHIIGPGVNVVLTANLPLANAHFKVSASATATFNIYKNSATIGTVVVVGVSATFNTSGLDVSLTGGDTFEIRAPVTPDGTLSDPTFTVMGTWS